MFEDLKPAGFYGRDSDRLGSRKGKGFMVMESCDMFQMASVLRERQRL